MTLVLCPECGEETMDQLVSCPLCDEPLAENQKNTKAENTRLFLLGLAFIGGLGAATLCNMMGYTAWAMGLGMVGLGCMAIFMLNLSTRR